MTTIEEIVVVGDPTEVDDGYGSGGGSFIGGPVITSDTTELDIAYLDEQEESDFQYFYDIYKDLTPEQKKLLDTIADAQNLNDWELGNLAQGIVDSADYLSTLTEAEQLNYLGATFGDGEFTPAELDSFAPIYEETQEPTQITDSAYEDSVNYLISTQGLSVEQAEDFLANAEIRDKMLTAASDPNASIDDTWNAITETDPFQQVVDTLVSPIPGITVSGDDVPDPFNDPETVEEAQAMIAQIEGVVGDTTNIIDQQNLYARIDYLGDLAGSLPTEEQYQQTLDDGSGTGGTGGGGDGLGGGVDFGVDEALDYVDLLDIAEDEAALDLEPEPVVEEEPAPVVVEPTPAPIVVAQPDPVVEEEPVTEYPITEGIFEDTLSADSLDDLILDEPIFEEEPVVAEPPTVEEIIAVSDPVEEAPVVEEAPAAQPDPVVEEPVLEDSNAEIAALIAALEAARQETQRLEAERLEAQRLEAERLEQERLEQERLAAARLEAEKLATEKAEQERIAAQIAAEEAAKAEAERLEAERLEAERIEAERIAAEEARIEAERVEAARIEAERIEAERIAAELAEAERVQGEIDTIQSGIDTISVGFDDFTGGSPATSSGADYSVSAGLEGSGLGSGGTGGGMFGIKGLLENKGSPLSSTGYDPNQFNTELAQRARMFDIVRR